MTPPEEDYERRLENMRAALARAWGEGYTRARRDAPRFEGDEWSDTPNPYAKEAQS